jgi:hypothetical protein
MREQRRDLYRRLVGLKVMADHHHDGGVRSEPTLLWESGIHTQMRGSLERGTVFGSMSAAVVYELRTQ